jgi:hypothetical protein
MLIILKILVAGIITLLTFIFSKYKLGIDANLVSILIVSLATSMVFFFAETVRKNMRHYHIATHVSSLLPAIITFFALDYLLADFTIINLPITLVLVLLMIFVFISHYFLYKGIVGNRGI